MDVRLTRERKPELFGTTDMLQKATVVPYPWRLAFESNWNNQIIEAATQKLPDNIRVHR